MNQFKKIADSSEPNHWDKIELWKEARPSLKETQMPPYICFECGEDTVRIGRYDRYACENCMIWAEPQCSCGPKDRCPFEVSPPCPNAIDFKDKKNV